MFTLVSTGEPKGVMVTHRNIECNTRDIVAYMGLTPADRVMVVLPVPLLLWAVTLAQSSYGGCLARVEQSIPLS